jgi:hypothetical protein
MAESEDPLVIPIRFDTSGAETDLNALENRARQGVTVPTRAGGAPPGLQSAAQSEVEAAVARGDMGTARRIASQVPGTVIPSTPPPAMSAIARERYDTRYENRQATDAYARSAPLSRG